MDGVEHSWSRAPHAMTEINFGLHSAGRGHLVRHGRPRQGSTYLRTAMILKLITSRLLLHQCLFPSALCATERGRPALAGLQGQVFWEATAFLLSFWASRRPYSPFSPRGSRRMGDAHRGRFCGKSLRAISCFSHQDAQTPPSPCVGEGGWGDEGQRRTGMQKAGRASFQRARNIPE